MSKQTYRYDDIAHHSRRTFCLNNVFQNCVVLLMWCVIQYLLRAACWEYVFPEYDGNYVE